MIATIENALIARARAASDNDVLGYKLRHVDSYPADWDLYLKDAQIGCPALWVTFGGWSPIETSRSGARVRATFGLVVAAMNHRNEVATRHGVQTATGIEVGSYQMALDACGLFQGHDLGLPIGALEVGALQFVRPIAALQERKWSMLALQLTTQFTVPKLDFGGQALGDFATFAVDWESPLGNPVASDHITLPTT